MTYEDLAREIGRLTDQKNKAYGESHGITDHFFRLLYPNGIPVEAYGTVTTLARIFDKLSRIATDPTAFNEDPWADLAGYALLGLKRAREQKGRVVTTGFNQTSSSVGPITQTIHDYDPVQHDRANCDVCRESGIEG